MRKNKLISIKDIRIILMFDNKFWAILLGFVIVIIGSFFFNIITVQLAISNATIGIIFYLLGRIDENGTNSEG